MTSPPSHSDNDATEFPFVRQVVLDCPNPRVLAEFYRELLGYVYREGDEAPPAGETDPRGEDWLVLRPSPGDATSGRNIAFQATGDYVRPQWSRESVSDGEDTRQRQMLYLDMTVPDFEALEQQRDRAVALGATILDDQTADEDEPLYVFADPAGHPFCIFV